MIHSEPQRSFNVAININYDAVNAFRLKFTDANAIVTKGENGFKSDTTYTGPLSALKRTTEVKSENNAARTELLCTLGEAFGLTDEIKTNNDGKTTFSETFMDQLEKALGKDFKRADFGINANGEVASGKPLTQRRIAAIIDKVDILGKGSFSLEVYQKKFNAIVQELKFPTKQVNDPVSGNLVRQIDVDAAPLGARDIHLYARLEKVLNLLQELGDKKLIEIRANPDTTKKNGMIYCYDSETKEYQHIKDGNELNSAFQNLIGMDLDLNTFTLKDEEGYKVKIDLKTPEGRNRFATQASDLLKDFAVALVNKYEEAKLYNNLDAFRNDAGAIDEDIFAAISTLNLLDYSPDALNVSASEKTSTEDFFA